MQRVWAISICVVLAAGFAAAGGPYEQKQDVVYGEMDGAGLLMDIFTPTGAKNGLGIVDIASGAWNADRGKINDHKMAKMYDIFC